MPDMLTLSRYPLYYWGYIKSIGITPDMEEFEKRKMSIFNQLNFFGVAVGFCVPLLSFFTGTTLPPLAWYAAGSPVAISFFVLWLNSERYYEIARMVYFGFYPMVTCLVYLGKADVGIELFFIQYGIMSVFFFHRTLNIVLSLSLSMICYFMADVIPHDYFFRLSDVSYPFYVLNHLLGIGFIFYALYLVKKENTGYQFSLLRRGRELQQRNLEIEKQRFEIAEKASLLEIQTNELTELNQVKNKLFSVIAHDLKTPMYALRNVFLTMQNSKLPAREIRQLLPAIVNEMNYTTSLMENLLQWAKSQMKHASVNPEVINIQTVTHEVFQLLQLQAANKKIYLESRIDLPLYCYADREMVNLVLRNLLSNAIKFTPENGTILVGASEKEPFVEVFVQDTGIGMTPEDQQLLFKDINFTTMGTNSEGGTGIGLMLCKDFLEKNGGHISVKSNPGEGSVFSFTLPRYDEKDN